MSTKAILLEKLRWCSIIVLVGSWFFAIASALFTLTVSGLVVGMMGYYVALYAYQDKHPVNIKVRVLSMLIAIVICVIGGGCAGLWQLALCRLPEMLNVPQFSSCNTNDIEATIFAGMTLPNVFVLYGLRALLVEHRHSSTH
ncbi:MAG: hypothetical protein JXA33_29135 [Anaerolineae bacterium]|nr:hypothetical protein [Anaerolineae bacterium]